MKIHVIEFHSIEDIRLKALQKHSFFHLKVTQNKKA